MADALSITADARRQERKKSLPASIIAVTQRKDRRRHTLPIPLTNNSARDEAPSPMLTTPLTAAVKPREERPFTDFFPLLDADRPLPVLVWPAPTERQDVGNRSLFSSISHHVINTVVQRHRSSRSRLHQPQSDQVDDNDAAAAAVVDAQFIEDDDLLRGGVLVLKGDMDKLPKCEFSRIPTAQQIQYGTQVNFDYPSGHYLRYTEPAEDELFDRVEYDMDEQDFCWLTEVNVERQRDGLPGVSMDVFELIIDQLEKHWFHLTKDMLKASQEPYSPEECVCNICQDGEAENSNAIIFCDGCNLAVHQDCYGVPYIPEGPWLCRKCMVSPQSPVSCVFCPNEGGAFKQTTTNQWAHLLCALWIPEVSIINPVYAEPIDGLNRVPKSRWKLNCYLCKKKMGACIQCHKTTCFSAFHVTCARKAGLYMKMKHYTQDGEEYTIHKAFCHKHTPSQHRNRGDAEADAIVEVGSDHDTSTAVGTSSMWEDHHAAHHADASTREKKMAQAHKHGFSSMGPVAPQFVLDQIMQRLDQERIIIRQRQRFIPQVCRYWSLKRQQRRGAPFLKRLHLEPWTAFSTAIRESEAIRLARFRVLSQIRTDLESVRMLTDLVRKREKQKLKNCQTQMQFLRIALTPHIHVLTIALEEIKKIDKYNFFAVPVRAEDVPDYYDIIKNPMDFNTMEKKLEKLDYDTVEQFEDDVNLVISNCLLYNKPDTIYAKTAIKIKTSLPFLMHQARQTLDGLDTDDETGMALKELPVELFKYPCVDFANLSNGSVSVPQLLQPPVPRKTTLSPPKPLATRSSESLSAASPSRNNAPAELPVVKTSALEEKPKPPAQKIVKKEQQRPPPKKTSEKQRKRDSGKFWAYVEVETEDEEGGSDTETNLPRTRSGTSLNESMDSKRPLRKRNFGEIIEESAVTAKPNKKIKTQNEPEDQQRTLADLKSPSVSSRRSSRVFAPQVDERLQRIIDNVQKEFKARKDLKKPSNNIPKDLVDVGYISWVKLSGFPWFPAEVYSNSSPEIPSNITPMEDGMVGNFFDRDMETKRTWISLPNDKFRAFDFGLNDANNLRAVLKKGKEQRRQVFHGYLIACLSRGHDPFPVFAMAGLRIPKNDEES